MKVIKFEEINSTNEYAKIAYQELDNNTVIIAKHQTAGKGRLGRTWLDKDANSALFTILIKDHLNTSNISNLTPLMATSVLKVLNNITPGFSIKWPNDIYYQDKKVVGILTESKINNNNVEYVIIGVGINVNQSEFEDSLNAISVRQITNQKTDIDTLIIEIATTFISDLTNYFKNDLTYLQIIEDNFYLKDKQVTFIYNNEERTGKVVGIDKFGGILIEENNTIKSYQTGEMLLKKK